MSVGENKRKSPGGGNGPKDSGTSWGRALTLVILSLVGISVMNNSISANPLSYKILATERISPFLKHGKPPIKEEHKAAVKKWPDVRSCLVESERTKQIPDLRQIDWDQLNTIEEADVCLFRIFSSIGSMDDSVEWLQFHGFKIDGPRDSQIKMEYLDKIVRAKYVNGGILIGWRKEWPKFPTCCLKVLWITTIAYSQNISIIWSDNEQLISIHNGYGIK